MDWYKNIKNWYGRSFWDKKMVGDAVVAGKITVEQYKTITDDEYVIE